MKVCLSSREVIWGGGEVFLYDLGNELISRGIDVTWRLESHSELAKRIPFGSLTDRRKRTSYDLLVANDFRSLWQAVAFEGPGGKVFVGHGPWQFSPARIRLLKAVRAKTFVVSDSVARDAEAKGFHERPLVLPLGPRPSLGRPRKGRDSYESKKVSEVTFGCVARLDPIKRLPLFASTIQAIGARAIVVTPAPKSPEETAVHDLLAASDHIELRAGGDVLTLWEDADVFLSTSSFESLGLAHLEALRSGVPVISTAAAGPGDFLIGELKHGWIPGVDGNALSDRIAQSLEAIQRSSEAYWDDADRVLGSRGIARCADLIIGAKR